MEKLYRAGLHAVSTAGRLADLRLKAGDTVAGVRDVRMIRAQHPHLVGQ